MLFICLFFLSGSRPGRSSQDQVIRWTEDNQCCFDRNLKVAVVLVDLSDAYDTAQPAHDVKTTLL